MLQKNSAENQVFEGSGLKSMCENSNSSLQGLYSVCENSVLEGNGFSRTVNDIAIPGFSR
jgi:hypothetical protein